MKDQIRHSKNTDPEEPDCSSPPCYAHEVDPAYMGLEPKQDAVGSDAEEGEESATEEENGDIADSIPMTKYG